MRESVSSGAITTACFGRREHKVIQGGLPMGIKHRHPDYETQEDRREQLRELNQACVNMILRMRLASSDLCKRTA